MRETENSVLNSDADLNKLIGMLTQAYSHKWISYYQSWIGALLMEGPMRNEIKPEMSILSKQELNHALSIKRRIIQLGEVPPTGLSVTMKHPHCQPPTDNHIKFILNQSLINKRYAIEMYKEIADFTYEKDPLTHGLVTSILNDELTHKRELEKWLNDIAGIKSEVTLN